MAVELRREGRVGEIVLDHPPANSYDIVVMRELASAIDEAVADDGLGAVVVRSASPKFFCAGADVKRFLASDTEANMEMIGIAHEALSGIARAPKAFIAQIAGHALGGGLEVALACDLRFAAEGSYRLGTPEVQLGLLPGNGGTQRLPRLVGIGAALELMLTGRTLTPAEALDLGLVGVVVAAEELEQRTRAAAEALAAGPALAIAHIKRAAYEGRELSLEDGLRLERALVEELFRSDDAREGLTAFVEKRSPSFAGR